MHLYEDLHAVATSPLLTRRIEEHTRVLNSQNRARGIDARRGDGTFGEPVPRSTPLVDSGYVTARAEVATIEIGVEVKILMKSMIKQIDRVTTDLRNQADVFRRHEGAICVAAVGINEAEICTTYEGERAFTTNGRNHRHPVQEAAESAKRLLGDAKPAFDEFLLLRFRATNAAPYAFEWVDATGTERDYGAALVRIARHYDRRFGDVARRPS